MSRATIQAIDRDQALRFWQGQRDGRIFLHPDVLESMCPQVDWWLGSWNTWPACLWPVCHGADGIHAPPELAAYVGPIWADDTLAGPAHRQWTTTSRLQELFLQEFATRYRRFRFELPPGSTDIRVLQWFAREHAAAWRVDIDCRHTLVLHRPATVDAASVAAGFGRAEGGQGNQYLHVFLSGSAHRGRGHQPHDLPGLNVRGGKSGSGPGTAASCRAAAGQRTAAAAPAPGSCRRP